MNYYYYEYSQGIDWATIFATIISTLLTLIFGFFLAKYAMKQWKKQFYYQKKVEIYADFVPYLRKIESFLKIAYENDLTTDETIGSETQKIIVKMLNNEVYPLTERFFYYFDDSYRKPMDNLLNLLKDMALKGERDYTQEELDRKIDESYFIIFNAKDTITLD